MNTRPHNNSLSLYHDRLNSNQANLARQKIKLKLSKSPPKNRSPLRNLTKANAYLRRNNNTATRSIHKGDGIDKNLEDQERKKKLTRAVKKTETHLPSPSAISGNRWLNASPPRDYEETFRLSSAWDTTKEGMEISANNRVSPTSKSKREVTPNLRKSAIQDVLQKFNCNNLSAATPYATSIVHDEVAKNRSNKQISENLKHRPKSTQQKPGYGNDREIKIPHNSLISEFNSGSFIHSNTALPAASKVRPNYESSTTHAENSKSASPSPPRFSATKNDNIITVEADETPTFKLSEVFVNTFNIGNNTEAESNEVERSKQSKERRRSPTAKRSTPAKFSENTDSECITPFDNIRRKYQASEHRSSEMRGSYMTRKSQSMKGHKNLVPESQENIDSEHSPLVDTNKKQQTTIYRSSGIMGDNTTEKSIHSKKITKQKISEFPVTMDSGYIPLSDKSRKNSAENKSSGLKNSYSTRKLGKLKKTAKNVVVEFPETMDFITETSREKKIEEYRNNEMKIGDARKLGQSKKDKKKVPQDIPETMSPVAIKVRNQKLVERRSSPIRAAESTRKIVQLKKQRSSRSPLNRLMETSPNLLDSFIGIPPPPSRKIDRDLGQSQKLESLNIPPMPLSGNTSNDASSLDIFLDSAEDTVTLRDMRLKLLEKDDRSKNVAQSQLQRVMSELVQQDYLVKKLTSEKEDLEKQVTDYEEEWKKSQRQIKRMLAEEVVEWFRTEGEAGALINNLEETQSREARLQNDLQKLKFSQSKTAEKRSLPCVEEKKVEGTKEKKLSKENLKLKATLKQARVDNNIDKLRRKDFKNEIETLQADLQKFKDGRLDDSDDSSYCSSAVSLTLRAGIVELKSQLSEKEAELLTSKSALEKERQRHKEAECYLKRNLEHVDIKSQLSEMKAKVQEGASASEKEKERHKEIESRLQKELNEWKKKHSQIFDKLESRKEELSNETKYYKDQLKKSEDSVEKLQKGIDDHLKTWVSEEQKFQNDINLLEEKLIVKNKEYKGLSELGKEKERNSTRKLQNLQGQLSITKSKVKELNDVKGELNKEKKKVNKLENTSKLMTQQHASLIQSLREKNCEVQREYKRLQNWVKEFREESKCLECEKEAEINKLKEELNHAEFRVQVLKKEASPKKKGRETIFRNSDDNAQEQCQEKLDSNNNRIRLECESSALQASGLSTREDTLQAEIAELTFQLNDARLRSRRIAVKSEAERAKVRYSEESVKRCAEKYEVEVKKWKCEFQRSEKKCEEEIEFRKEVEAILQKKIKVLSQDNAQPFLPSSSFSKQTDSKSIIESMLSLALAITKLTASARRIKGLTEQNHQIEKDSVDAIINDLGEVNCCLANVEAAVEEQNKKSKSACQMFENSVDSYEKRIEKKSQKHEKVTNNMQQQLKNQNEQLKQQKQVELDTLSKCASLKGRYVQLKQDYEACKMQAEEREQKHSEKESWFLAEISRMEALILPKKQNTNDQRISKIVSDHTRNHFNQSMRLKLHQGSLKEEVEIRLREDDESVTSLFSQGSIFSQGEVSNMRAEIKQLKQLVKEMHKEAEDLKLDRDRERKLREISMKQTTSAKNCATKEKLSTIIEMQ